jgi:hypothetical protein
MYISHIPLWNIKFYCIFVQERIFTFNSQKLFRGYKPLNPKNKGFQATSNKGKYCAICWRLEPKIWTGSSENMILHQPLLALFNVNGFKLNIVFYRDKDKWTNHYSVAPNTYQLYERRFSAFVEFRQKFGLANVYIPYPFMKYQILLHICSGTNFHIQQSKII